MNSNLATKIIILLFTTFSPTISPATEFISIDVIHGLAKVIDGDGVEINGVEIRLQGIAAPEHRKNPKTIGNKSTKNLRNLVDGKYLICHMDGTKAGKRPVGVCFLNILDIGQLQVETGHARDCEAFSNGRYNKFELAAKSNGHDLSIKYELPQYCS